MWTVAKSEFLSLPYPSHFTALKLLSVTTRHGAPFLAVAIQLGLSLLMIASAGFESILTYVNCLSLL